MTDARSRARATAVGAALLVLLAAGAARAEPYLAVREGVLCSQCHENRTGGGKRTPFGVIFSQTVMPLYKITTTDRTSEQGREQRGWLFDPHLGDYFSVGGDLRFQNLTLLPAHTEWNGKQESAPAANTFRIPVANLYLEASLFKDRLVAYLDETVGPEGASAREAFVMYRDLPLNGYVKAGRFLLPFGLRLPDDTIFVRDMTGFNYANQDLGVEVGVEPGPFFASVALTNGTQGAIDNNFSKQVTATAGALFRPLRFALSYSYADGSTDKSSSMRHVAGAYAGIGLGRLVLLGEFDAMRDYSGPGTEIPQPGSSPIPSKVRWQLAGYGEADLLVYRGVNLRFAYDWHDPNFYTGPTSHALLAVPNDTRERFTFAAEITPIPFLAIGVFYYLRRDIPQRPAENQDQFLIQIHGFM